MRLVTRPDFDGIVSGALITALEDIDSYLFVEPKFMQDGVVDIRHGDIIANLPYHPACSLWFDHHFTNGAAGFDRPVIAGRGAFRMAPSAARVVYEYYSEVPSASPERYRSWLPTMDTHRVTELLRDTDKIDGGTLTRDDVLHPAGYVLISMTIYGKESDEEPYWRRLIDLIRERPLAEILDDPEVRRRCDHVLGSQERLRQQPGARRASRQRHHSRSSGHRDLTDANRFCSIRCSPEGNISMKIARDSQRAHTTASSGGYNIFNTTSTVNVGDLLSHYGGGRPPGGGILQGPGWGSGTGRDEILRHISEPAG